MHLERNVFCSQNSHANPCRQAISQGRGHRLCRCCRPGQSFGINSHPTAGLLSTDWSFSQPATPKVPKWLLQALYSPGRPTILNSYLEPKKCSSLIELVRPGRNLLPELYTDGENLPSPQVGCSLVS